MLGKNCTNSTYPCVEIAVLHNASTEAKFTTAEAILVGTFLSFIVFLSIAGNILVVIAIFTERTLKKTSNFFLVSLAIADLLVAILVMSFAVANDILGYWIFGPKFCGVWISFDIMCSTASILNLCVISLDRYIHIRNPLQYENWMTNGRCLVMIAIVWSCSVLISFLPMNLGWHGAFDQEPGPVPVMQLDRPLCILEFNPIYAVVSSCISFYLPCLVMIAIYIKLYRCAQKHVKNIRRTCAPDYINKNAPGQAYKVSDHKAAMTLGVIMGTFLFCWVPFFTVNIIEALCRNIPPLVFALLTWLGYINSALNPIIYSIFNQEFREAFKKVLSIHRCKTAHGLNFNKVISNNSNANNAKGEYGSVDRKDSKSQLVEKITAL